MADLPQTPANDRDRIIGPWAAHARRWARLAPPLRPCPEDLQRLKDAWLESLPAGPPARCIDLLSLGVTPEIALFPWAERVCLRAIDSSDEMIRAVWPGDGPDRKAVLGNWLQAPFADASFDVIVCDAGLAQFAGVKNLVALGRELHRLLRHDGRVVMRHFARPARVESEQSIVEAVEAGRVRNFHELKLRLLMALEARTPTRGVCLGDAWERFEQIFPDREALARRLDCDLETIALIDAYRGKEARYSFLPLDELARVFDSFRILPGPPGHYPFAEHCPVFSLTPIR